jgi:hypothetical protein
MTVFPVRKCKTRRPEFNWADIRKRFQPFELLTSQDVEIFARWEQSANSVPAYHDTLRSNHYPPRSRFRLTRWSYVTHTVAQPNTDRMDRKPSWHIPVSKRFLCTQYVNLVYKANICVCWRDFNGALHTVWYKTVVTLRNLFTCSFGNRHTEEICFRILISCNVRLQLHENSYLKQVSSACVLFFKIRGAHIQEGSEQMQ